MSTSRLWQKVGASVINCGLVLCLSLPLYLFASVEIWKMGTVAIFFLYNILFRRRCLGMRVVGTFIDPPTNILYVALYSLGFSTFFYSVWFPMDLLFANTTLQVTSLAMTHNTLHANLAGQGTMSREHYLNRAKECARLIHNQGDLAGAVELMATYLDRWPDLRQPQWIIDMGRRLANEGNEGMVLVWIEGFE